MKVRPVDSEVALTGQIKELVDEALAGCRSPAEGAEAQIKEARKQAFADAMNEIEKLRTLAATDFKSPNCQGQRGVDRTDAFFDAYHAIRKLSAQGEKQ